MSNYKCPYCGAPYMRCKTDDRGICVKKPKQHTILLTRKAPLHEYAEVARDHHAFTNTTGTFYGKPVTKLDGVRIRGNLRAEDKNDVAYALLMDEPDYIIFTDQARPIAWHSTTRGNRRSPHEWVIGDNRNGRYYRAHYRIAEHIVTTLNAELADQSPYRIEPCER